MVDDSENGYDCKRWRCIKGGGSDFPLLVLLHQTNNFGGHVLFACTTVRDIRSWRVPLISASLSVSKCHPPPTTTTITLFLAYIDGMRMRSIKHNGFLIRIKVKRLNTSKSLKKKEKRKSLTVDSHFGRFSFLKKKYTTRQMKQTVPNDPFFCLRQQTNEEDTQTNQIKLCGCATSYLETHSRQLQKTHSYIRSWPGTFT